MRENKLADLSMLFAVNALEFANLVIVLRNLPYCIDKRAEKGCNINAGVSQP